MIFTSYLDGDPVCAIDDLLNIIHETNLYTPFITAFMVRSA